MMTLFLIIVVAIVCAQLILPILDDLFELCAKLILAIFDGLSRIHLADLNPIKLIRAYDENERAKHSTNCPYRYPKGTGLFSPSQGACSCGYSQGENDSEKGEFLQVIGIVMVIAISLLGIVLGLKYTFWP